MARTFEFVSQFVGCVTVTVSPNQIIIIIIIIYTPQSQHLTCYFFGILGSHMALNTKFVNYSGSLLKAASFSWMYNVAIKPRLVPSYLMMMTVMIMILVLKSGNSREHYNYLFTIFNPSFLF